MSELSEKIKYERKKKKIKQSEISKKLNVSLRTYQRYENGESDINENLLEDISKILKIEFTELLKLSLKEKYDDLNFLIVNMEYLKKLMDYKGYQVYEESGDNWSCDYMIDKITNEKISFSFIDFFDHITDYIEFYINQEFKEYRKYLHNQAKTAMIEKNQK